MVLGGRYAHKEGLRPPHSIKNDDLRRFLKLH